MKRKSNPVVHGKIGTYANHKCRCALCKAAWNSYHQARKVIRAAQINADDPRHGTITLYGGHGCRCRPCKTAWAKDSNRHYRKRAAARSGAK